MLSALCLSRLVSWCSRSCTIRMQPMRCRNTPDLLLNWFSYECKLLNAALLNQFAALNGKLTANSIGSPSSSIWSGCVRKLTGRRVAKSSLCRQPIVTLLCACSSPAFCNTLQCDDCIAVFFFFFLCCSGCSVKWDEIFVAALLRLCSRCYAQ